MYRCGLKDYICAKLKLYKPQTIEEARHATRFIEQKHKFNLPSFKEDKNQQQYSGTKETNRCRYCEDKWTSGHRSLNKKLYTYEVEKELDKSSNELKKWIKK